MTVDKTAERAPSVAGIATVGCRLCGSTRLRSFLDLGATPPCELFLTAEAVGATEPTYPAPRASVRALPARPVAAIDHSGGNVHRVRLLLLVLQLVGRSTPSGSSRTSIERLGLEVDSFVVEVASNDGYLLQHFVRRWILAWGSSRRST